MQPLQPLLRMALDPASTAFYHQYILHGDSRNHSISLRCESLLDRALFTQALLLTLHQHPLLRAKAVADRSNPKYWYYWEARPLAQITPEQLPCTWVALECAKNRTRQEIRTQEQAALNQPICLDQAFPWRIFVFQCPTMSFTHLQLILSHAAADGRSLVLWLKDLIAFYAALASGQTPVAEPLGFASGDWERLFQCPIDQFTRRMIQTPVFRDNQRRRLQNQPCTGERQDWSALATVLQRNQAKRDPERNTLSSFPGLPAQAELAPNPLFTLHHTLNKQKVEKLALLAQAYQTNSYDLLTVAYLRAHRALARELGEIAHIAPLALLSDLRQVSRNPALVPLLGNLVMGIRILVDLGAQPTDDLTALLKNITEQKLAGLKDWKLNLKKNLMLAVVQEPVPVEGLKSFLQVVTQARKAIPVSHLGQLDRLFPSAKILKISQIETNPVASPVSLQTLHWNDQISLAYSYQSPLIRPESARQLWEGLMQELERLSQINC